MLNTRRRVNEHRSGPRESEADNEVLHDAKVGLVGQDEGRLEKREAHGVARSRLHREVLGRGPAAVEGWAGANVAGDGAAGCGGRSGSRVAALEEPGGEVLLDPCGKPPACASDVATTAATVEFVDKVGRRGGGKGILKRADRDAAGDGDDPGLNGREGQSGGGSDALLHSSKERVT